MIVKSCVTAYDLTIRRGAKKQAAAKTYAICVTASYYVGGVATQTPLRGSVVGSSRK
jgi:hypothetical protein